MKTQITITMLVLCALAALVADADATSIPVVVTATAFEAGGTQPDVFSLTFTCDCDIRILQVIWDMTPSAGHLFFDTTPSGNEGYDFHALPDAYFPGLISTATVFQHFSADNSPQIVVQFSEFKPGEVLYFDIDVDGPSSSTFTAGGFAGTGLGIIFDPSPAFPGAQPYGAVFLFTDQGGQAVAFGGQDVPVSEPATTGLMAVGALAGLGWMRRRSR